MKEEKVKVDPIFIEALIKGRYAQRQEIEEKMGVPIGYLSSIINGKIKGMKSRLLYSFLEAIGVSISDYEDMLPQALNIISDSTISNEIRKQKLYLLISTYYQLKETQNSKHKK